MTPPATHGKFRSAHPRSPGRVLVVDDDALVCWSLASGLRGAGLEVFTASTAAEVLVLARVRPHFDAVLLDARLHDRDPSSLVRELRVIAPDCQFLMMTTDRDDAAPAPHDALVVRKPFDLPDVVRQVEAAVTHGHPGR